MFIIWIEEEYIINTFEKISFENERQKTEFNYRLDMFFDFFYRLLLNRRAYG